MFAEACFAEKLALDPADIRALQEAALTRLPVSFPRRTKADPYAGLNLFIDRKRRSGQALPAQISLPPSHYRQQESTLPIGDHLVFTRNARIYH